MELVVAISGVQGTDVARPGPVVAQCLAESCQEHLSVILLEGYPVAASLSGRVPCREVRYFPSSGAEIKIMRELLRETEEQHRINVLIPCDDADVHAAARIEQELKRAGLHVMLPHADAVEQTQKANLFSFCTANSVPTPPAWLLEDGRLKLPANNITFPVICKGPLCDSYLASSWNELRVYVDRIMAIWGGPVILQEFVPGEEYAVCGLADRRSRVLSMVAIKKLGITEKGKTWAAVTVSEPRLLRLFKDVVSALRWVGPLEVEAIRDSRNGRFTVIELNPRFPAWVYLAFRAGKNLPLLLVQAAIGERPHLARCL